MSKKKFRILWGNVFALLMTSTGVALLIWVFLNRLAS